MSIHKGRNRTQCGSLIALRLFSVSWQRLESRAKIVVVVVVIDEEVGIPKNSSSSSSSAGMVAAFYFYSPAAPFAASPCTSLLLFYLLPTWQNFENSDTENYGWFFNDKDRNKPHFPVESGQFQYLWVVSDLYSCDYEDKYWYSTNI